ncbi:zinc transporter ZntB [Pseudomonas fragi]|uniref:Zinc transporter ZntB n=1 Tax=Pseudomonas fragi TaxID=296 RepID=A0A266LRM8_PSEFR|nr:CorA family divalent cation transporter [Pseudomonas fragi]OZY39955.1 zinc transporter ZntB [Pseudomonas fragi]
MYEDVNAQWGLVHALVLDGEGGAREIARTELNDLQLQAHESIWLHWDRSHPQTQNWLRESSGLSDFSCDLLLEENTRPRLVPLPANELLLFMRGVNLNPGAEPEDMVSLRIFGSAQRLISLRMRPLRATDELLGEFSQGEGPKNTSELILYLAQHLTLKVQDLIGELSEIVDDEEDKIDADERYTPDHNSILQVRRRAAALRRFLAPQRDIFGQLTRIKLPWFSVDDADYWNELNNSLTRYLEELELTRERVGLVLESEDRRLNVRMSRIMYRFGVLTGIFLPITFITGLLGINVGGVPFSDDSYGFAITCGVMLVIGVGQWWFYRRLQWL